jgi:hypothetical protein
MVPSAGLVPWLTLQNHHQPTDLDLAILKGDSSGSMTMAMPEIVGGDDEDKDPDRPRVSVQNICFIPRAWAPYFLAPLTPWEAFARYKELIATIPKKYHDSFDYLHAWFAISCIHATRVTESILKAKWQSPHVDRRMIGWMQRHTQYVNAMSMGATASTSTGPVLDPQECFNALVQGLCRDLELIAESKLEAVQLVPIASIDASLLYGVVIGVRAGLENDLDQHNEMGLLVRTLFIQLSSKDCALLLRSTNKEGPPPSDSTRCGLFHDYEQTFLLMTEEIPTPLKHQTSPTSGVLYRLASADHFIQEMSPADVMSSDKDENNPFTEYMEASLDCLVWCSPVNMLYLSAQVAQKSTRALVDRALAKVTKSRPIDRSGRGGSLRTATASQRLRDDVKQQTTQASFFVESSDSSVEEKEVGWNDKSGVGSRMRAFSQESDSLDEVESEAKERVSEKIGNSAKLIRNQLTSKVASSKSKAQAVFDELEWTDETGGYCSPNSESSEDIDSRMGKVGVFEYSEDVQKT